MFDNSFTEEREIVLTLANQAMQTTLEDRRKQDELTMGLHYALQRGVPIDDLSADTGIPPEQIRARVNAMIRREDPSFA